MDFRTEEEDELFAGFMGFEKTDLGWYDAEECLSVAVTNYGTDNTFDDFKFHCSFDWLMSVVDKVEGVLDEHGMSKYNIAIEQTFVEVMDMRTSDTIVKVDKNTKIEALYYALTDFINWYNENLNAKE